MKRDECWMTFSEALESYLDNRDLRAKLAPGRNRDDCEEQMRVCAEHMDALTGASHDQA